MKRIFLFICFLLSMFSAIAIKPIWSIEFGTLFDNREGDDKMCEDKTFFFTTLSPEIGLKFSDIDRISGGVVWTQPLENGVKDGKIIPTLYYRHESDKWKFSMGMFPRTQLREPLPGFIWCDSLSYFQRNLRGALIQYEVKNGFFDAYIDWRAHQTETRREAFNIMFHGETHPGRKAFLIGTHLLMNHFAKTRHANENESIVDNFLVNPYIGFNLSKTTTLDSLVVKAGGLYTIERYREYKGWKTPGGFLIDILAEWKFLGLHNSFYKGAKLFPLYSEFGTQLYQGEPYYQSDLYNRTDIYAHVYCNKYIDVQAQLNFNIARNNFMFYQRLMVEIHLDSGK